MIRDAMLIVIAALSAVAFVVLFRLLWLSSGKRMPQASRSTVITIAAAVLVVGLALLAASGRLHWLAAVGAALAPFLRRGLGLLRYVPLLGSLLRKARAGAQSGQGGGRRAASGDAMTRGRALEILGLSGNPSRDEILAAHRRLIQKLHPDRGGSTYLAQQLNDAKARLLDDGA
jgi:hypothetical protein